MLDERGRGGMVAARVEDWIGRGRLVAVVGSGQAVVQALALVAGLVVIRMLPADEFAAYTIAMAAVGALGVLSDSGVVSAVTAAAGRHWQDPARLGAAIASGRRVRRRLAWIAGLFVLPPTAVLLHRQGVDPLAVALLLGAAVAVFAMTAVAQLYEVAPRLHQRVGALQRVQILNNAARIAATIPTLALAASGWLAMAVSALVQAWTNARLRRLASDMVTEDARPDTATDSFVMAQVRRTAPGAIYFAVTAPLTVWLAAALGTTAVIAEVGALGRVGTLFTLVQASLGMLAIPRYARLPAEETGLQWSRYVQFQLAALTACGLLCVAVLVAVRPLRWILGPEYAAISEIAFLLMALGGTASTLSMLAWGLAAARGFITPAWLALPYCILWRVLLIVALPMDSVEGLLTLALIAASTEWLLHVAWYRVAWNRGRKN